MPSPFSPAPVDIDETTIKINGKVWRFWNDLEINRGIDSYTSATFTAPFDAKRREVRETFRPFSFAPTEISIGGVSVDVGTMVLPQPEKTEASGRVAVTCHSKPAVLLMSDAPISILPFEARGLTLKQVAERVCEPFGIDVVFEGDPGPPFKRVKQKLDGKVQAFLVELAQQRGFVMSSTGTGQLWFRKSVAVGRTVARLREGVPPVLSVSPTFNPDEYFSEITGVIARKVTRRASKYTAKNPRLHSVLRCQTVTFEQSERADAPGAVQARMGRMFANAFSVSVEVPTWRDPSGALYSPNTTVTLLAPDAMIYNEYEFLVRTVSLRRSNEAKTATLGLVLPGVFNAALPLPSKFPWD